MPKTEERPYVHIAVLHDAETGRLVGISPIQMLYFQETETDNTTFTFTDGLTLTVEEDLYGVLDAFNKGQKEAPMKRRR